MFTLGLHISYQNVISHCVECISFVFKEINTYNFCILEVHRCHQNNVCNHHTSLSQEYILHCCYTCNFHAHSLCRHTTARRSRNTSVSKTYANVLRFEKRWHFIMCAVFDVLLISCCC